MQHLRRTSFQNGGMLVLLGAFVLGLFMVAGGILAPVRSARGVMPTVAAANGELPPVIMAIKTAETKDAQLMFAALDRIGFDLDAVQKGYISVPRLMVSSLPPDLERLDAMDQRKNLFLRIMLPAVLTADLFIGGQNGRQHDAQEEILALVHGIQALEIGRQAGNHQARHGDIALLHRVEIETDAVERGEHQLRILGLGGL